MTLNQCYTSILLVRKENRITKVNKSSFEEHMISTILHPNVAMAGITYF